MPPTPLPSRHVLPLLLLAAGCVLLTALAQHHGFFWDNVLLASRYGQWYYHSHFRTLFVPDEIAGYPPLFGMGLAAVWSGFGLSVEAAHWAMVPFQWGIVWQVYALMRRLLPTAWVMAGTMLVLLDATLLAQLSLVAPDVVLVFLYLWGLNAVLAERRGSVALAAVLLGLLSPRGAVGAAALALTDVALGWLPQASGHQQPQPQSALHTFVRKLLAYLPALVLTVGWLWLHQRHFGWVGYRTTGNWASYGARVDARGLVRNVVLIGWRLLDHGRVFFWLTSTTLAWLLWRRGWRPSAATWRLGLLWLVPLLLLSAVVLPFANPIGHRYYLVPMLLLTPLTLHLLAQWPAHTCRRRVYGLLALGLLSGHFWVYPDHIANGWDASLAHWPYYRLHQRMIGWLDARHIPLSAVGTNYPNAYPLHDVDLTADRRQFAPVNLLRNRYVLQSNVMNFGDATLDSLQRGWQVWHEERAGLVYFRLYRRPD